MISCTPTTADVRTCADTVREEEIVAVHSLDLLGGRRGEYVQLRRNLGEMCTNEHVVSAHVNNRKTNTKLQYTKHKHKQQQ